MRLVFISDTHCQHKGLAIPLGNVLIWPFPKSAQEVTMRIAMLREGSSTPGLAFNPR